MLSAVAERKYFHFHRFEQLKRADMLAVTWMIDLSPQSRISYREEKRENFRFL